MFDLLVLTSLDNAKIIYFFTKQATLMRRSAVLSLPLQLAFPAELYRIDRATVKHAQCLLLS
jgi:hypothetical protein